MPLQGFSDIDPCTAVVQPGAGRLEYAPLDEVDVAAFDEALLLSGYNQQAAAGVTTWYLLPHTPGTGTWTEDQQDGEQGPVFRINITASLAADTPAVRGELDAMKRRQFLVRLTRGSQVLLAGSPEQPMRFESRFESGSQGGDTRSHRCTFSASVLKKIPGYVPVF